MPAAIAFPRDGSNVLATQNFLGSLQNLSLFLPISRGTVCW